MSEAKTDTPMARAEDLGRALMRGNRATFKTGYSYMNATLAVADMRGLDGTDAFGLMMRQRLLAYLFGFACGMSVPTNGSDSGVWHAINEGRRRGMRAFGSQYVEAFDRGHADGMKEDLSIIQPEGLREEE